MKLLLVPFVLVATSAFAQHLSSKHLHSPQSVQSGPASPYAGMQARPIKALSLQQMEDLRSGKGMALALPAELNGYPGPLHVLELANELKLTPQQKTTVERLYAAMKQETVSLGEQVIAAESQLDRLFLEKTATAQKIEAASSNAARLHGSLRAAHLRYRVHVARLLEPTQIVAYGKLRGYQ